MSKKLYVKSVCGFDLNIADLGIRIKAGTTIEIYSYSPYITEEAIQKSLTSGYLFQNSNPDKNGKIYCQILEKLPVKQTQTIKEHKFTKTPIENNVVTVNPTEHISEDGFLSVDYGFDTTMIKTLPTNLSDERVNEIKTLNDFFNTGAKTLQLDKEKQEKVSEPVLSQKVEPKLVENDNTNSIVMEVVELETSPQDQKLKPKSKAKNKK